MLIASLSALQNADEDALNEALPGLVAMTCRTQHTYAYALAVLRRVVSMTDEAGNVIVRPAVAAAAARLARELEQRAEHRFIYLFCFCVQQTNSTDVVAIRVPATAVALRLALPNFPHANAMASVSLMTSAQATNPSDIIQVRSCFVFLLSSVVLVDDNPVCYVKSYSMLTHNQRHHRYHCCDTLHCLVLEIFLALC